MTNPPLARETDKGRFYCDTRTGEMVPSVTNILKVIHKEEIESWKIRMAADHANLNWDEMETWHPSQRKEAMTGAHQAYSDEKAALGTLVHAVCEKFIKGIPAEIPREASSYMTQFTRFMMEKRPVWVESEVTVWSRSLEYAGTADFIAQIDGLTWLVDIKTGKGVYPEFGLQLAALKNADFIIREDCSEEPIPHIDNVAVLHLRPRSHRFIPILEEEENFRAFRAARDIFRWLYEVADDALGVAALWVMSIWACWPGNWVSSARTSRTRWASSVRWRTPR